MALLLIQNYSSANALAPFQTKSKLHTNNPSFVLNRIDTSTKQSQTKTDQSPQKPAFNRPVVSYITLFRIATKQLADNEQNAEQ